MTISELITKLQQYNPDIKVTILSETDEYWPALQIWEAHEPDTITIIPD